MADTMTDTINQAGALEEAAGAFQADLRRQGVLFEHDPEHPDVSSLMMNTGERADLIAAMKAAFAAQPAMSRSSWQLDRATIRQAVADALAVNPKPDADNIADWIFTSLAPQPSAPQEEKVGTPSDGDLRIVESWPGRFDIEEYGRTFWSKKLSWRCASEGSWFGSGPHTFEAKSKKIADHLAKIKHRQRVVAVFPALSKEPGE